MSLTQPHSLSHWMCEILKLLMAMAMMMMVRLMQMLRRLQRLEVQTHMQA